MRIGGVEIGPGQPCRVIAEVSNAHNGDRDRMGRLIDAAKAAGADLLKIQAYRPQELVLLRGNGPAPEPWGSQGFTMQTLYERAQTPLDWLPKIRDHCDRIGMPWFSSVFGLESLAALEAVDCPAYKLSHFECDDAALIQRVADTGKPLVISYRAGVAPSRVPHLRVWCPDGYPPTPETLHLDRLAFYDGLSLHAKHWLAAPLAVAVGAELIEVHVHLKDEPSVLEPQVSYDERELACLVEQVRQAEVLLR